jgi:circadian clock protein KaiC
MTAKKSVARIGTGIPNLDALLGGGLPKDSITALLGPPGSGKTILAQQICFHNASVKNPVLYFSTLSESSAKVLRYLTPFGFFDSEKIDNGIQFIDLGSALVAHGIQEAARLLLEHVKRVKPSIVVIDSFKVFDDFAESTEALRKFSYALSVNLMAWEATVLLLGEYGAEDIQSNPLFSIIDGQIFVYQRSLYDEEVRKLRIIKMRGTQHSRDENSFAITAEGFEVFAPRVTIQREYRGEEVERLKTGISSLDDLLGLGIPLGSSLLVSGVAGTGKTILLLDFIYRGALKGQKGILFSFEETIERLHAAAKAFGWDLQSFIDQGLIEVVFIPQPDIMVEAGLVMIEQRVNALGAKRVAIDSISVFLHKVRDPQSAREKVFQLASIVQNARAVGFLATDIAYGAGTISRFGVEETVVDGVILLTSTSEGLERQRYLEIYKLRQTAHLKGRHSIVIGKNGVEIFPRYSEEVAPSQPPVALGSQRLKSGVPGLDAMLAGGLLKRSVTVVSGGKGTGKSVLGLQFIMAGVAENEPGLYISLDEGPEQIAQNAELLGIPWREASQQRLVQSNYLSPENVRSSQFFSIIGDLIRTQKTRRLVLDGAGYLGNENSPLDELREMLLVLISQFKLLDVTTVLMLESNSMFSTEAPPDRSFAALADNLLLLRYEQTLGELKPFVMVVKTHNSAHDWNSHYYKLDHGGMRIGGRVSSTGDSSFQSEE